MEWISIYSIVPSESRNLWNIHDDITNAHTFIDYPSRHYNYLFENSGETSNKTKVIK